jgi:hypothetical protein
VPFRSYPAEGGKVNLRILVPEGIRIFRPGQAKTDITKHYPELFDAIAAGHRQFKKWTWTTGCWIYRNIGGECRR